jgi:hypothetical protein
MLDARGRGECCDSGRRTILQPHVFVGTACRIGSEREVHPHASIGGDGFSYAGDPDGKPRKIAHLGNVQIRDGLRSAVTVTALPVAPHSPGVPSGYLASPTSLSHGKWRNKRNSRLPEPWLLAPNVLRTQERLHRYLVSYFVHRGNLIGITLT